MKENRLIGTVSELKAVLANRCEQGAVGLVPTMGALHQGHLSLVQRAKSECATVVITIFVNPAQFNNAEDLKKYPRTLEEDIKKLKDFEDLLIFAPEVEEVYPSAFHSVDIDLGRLDSIMEGAFRPGHFKGVVTVVKRLFDIVNPTKAYFGLKDYQQLAVIKRMVDVLHLGIQIIPCEVVREKSGLAMSSRNARLSPTQLEDALLIYKALTLSSQLAKHIMPFEVKQKINALFDESPLILEYFELADSETLEEVTEFKPGTMAFVAAYCGEIRLIDNMQIS